MALSARFKLPPVAELAATMGFTPVGRRLAQLDAAETLLAELDPARAYPLDFVVYRITGFHRKKADAETHLTGLALQHDLGLLIELVSEGCDLPADGQSEPVLDIDAAAARFDVSTKSIQRWRRKGLAARSFLFPDGKRRIGFLLSSVERYVHGNGAACEPITGAELRAVVRQAARLAATCGEAEIARRIARRTGRSPMAILHVLRWHDGQHPDEAVLRHCRRPLTARQKRRILRGARRGVGLRRMARALKLPASAVGRVLVEAQARKLGRRKTKFIDDPLLHGPDAEAQIGALLAAETMPSNGEPTRVPRDLPPYLQALYRTPLLTPARERALFLTYNLHRYRFAQLRKRLDPMLVCARDLARLQQADEQATAAKNAIVQANLRLVVSVARKHLRPGLDLMELVSDGNLVLMRAVEGFDVSKGNKFSTYATLALMKGFARSVPAMQAKAASLQQRTGRDGVDLPDPADPQSDQSLSVQRRDEVHALLRRLDGDEREVLLARTGVRLTSDRLHEQDCSTLDQLADRLGLSKHRIRELERSALEKLRA